MQCPSAEELNRMTFQVGLLGNAGSVITSDRLLQQFEIGARSVDDQFSKFFKTPGLVCCWSGDRIAEHAAHGVWRSWRDAPFEKNAVGNQLEGIGDRGLEDVDPADQHVIDAENRLTYVCR